MSDAELARVAQNGDAASLGILLERHQAALYALALRIWDADQRPKTPSRTPSSSP